MTFKTLVFEKNEGIGLLKLNRPESLNSLNKEVLQDIGRFCVGLSDIEDLRCLIVTGMGDKAFVAGADIKEINALSSTEAEQFSFYGQEILSKFETLSVPVIAAVNGFALGGGLELALCCDFIWATEKSKFGLPEVSLGLIPGFGGTQRLARWVGLGKAREMIYSGNIYKAEEAFNIGLIQKIVSTESFIEDVMTIAKTIAQRGPIALARAKESINCGASLSLEQGLKVEAKLFSELFVTEDQKEGTLAFIEKRQPNFTGK